MVCFQTAKFVNIVNGIDTEEITYGYKIHDEYGRTYNEFLDEKEIRNLTVQEAFNLIKYNSETQNDLTLSDMFDSLTNAGSFLFNGTYTELKDIGVLQ